MVKKWQVATIASVVLMAGIVTFEIGAQAHTDNSGHENSTHSHQTVEQAKQAEPANLMWKKTHVTFTETALVDGVNVTQDVEAWFNEKGEYRLDFVSGPYAGNYKVWDGQKFYQYSKAFNELQVIDAPHGSGTPIGHMYFSSTATDRIKDDIKNKKLKKQGEGKKLGLSTKEFSKQETLNEVPETARHENKNLYKENNNKVTDLVNINEELSYVLNSSRTINDQIVYELYVNQIDRNIEFDPNLLIVNEPTANIINR